MSDVTTNRATWQNMQTKLQALGDTATVVIGEPKSAMQSGTIAIIPMGGNIAETTLQTARETHRLTIRRYETALGVPEQEIEFRLDAWRANMERDICGDFDLGGSTAYTLPTEFSWQYGYLTAENILYRFLDLNVAYRVDDRASFVQ